MKILLIRHGATQGNLERRYVGSTDEPLLPDAVRALRDQKTGIDGYVAQADGGGRISAQNESGKRAAADDPGSMAAQDEFEKRAAADDISCEKQSGGLKVYISPLLRARETAEILFPGTLKTEIRDFRECDFGEFEYRNYEELNGNPAYQNFIDSGGTCGFPGGETRGEFQARTVKAFLQLPEIREDGSSAGLRSTDEDADDGEGENGFAGTLAIVAHGGTIMALLDAFSDPHEDYFAWQVKNGEGYLCRWNPRLRKMTGIRRI